MQTVTNNTENPYFYLSALAEIGIQAKLSKSGTNILLAPKHLITPAIQSKIRKYKSELISELREYEQSKIESPLECSLESSTSKKIESASEILDPRPDLTSDAKLWRQLLQAARNIDANLAGTLHGFRCCGAEIVRVARGYALAWNRTRNDYWPDRISFVNDYREWLLGGDSSLIGRQNSAIYELLRGLES